MKKNQLFKKLASVTLAATITISSLSMGASAASVSDFTDVKPTDWYYAAVDYATSNGLFNGITATKFGANTSITRGMFVTVLGRLAKVDESEYLRYRFSDVKPGDYYAPYVEWAATYGIVTGATKTTFAPNKKITREQMAAILYRFAAATGNDTDFKTGALLNFSDKYKVESYALNSMGWAVDKGIINGMGGKLNAGGTATRAQVAKVFYEAQNVLTSTTITIDPVENEKKEDNTEKIDTPSTAGGFVYDGTDFVYVGDGSNFITECNKITYDESRFYYDNVAYDYTFNKETGLGTTKYYDNGFDFTCSNNTTVSTGSTFKGYFVYQNINSTATLTNGQPVTEKNVTSLIKSLKTKYPQGAKSPDCLSSAYNITDDVFSKEGESKLASSYNGIITKSLENFKPGDQFDYRSSDTDGHTVVVIQKAYAKETDGSIRFAGVVVAEGNYNGTYNWNRLISEQQVTNGTVEIYGWRSFY